MMAHHLRKRYGHGRAGSGKVRSYRAVSEKGGPAVIAYDARGRVVNAINGRWAEDTIEAVLRAAAKAWPDARNKTP